MKITIDDNDKELFNMQKVIVDNTWEINPETIMNIGKTSINWEHYRHRLISKNRCVRTQLYESGEIRITFPRVPFKLLLRQYFNRLIKCLKR
jgi:hypothetical protein